MGDDIGCDVGEVVALHDTPKAVLVVLVQLDGGQQWIPRSKIMFDSEVKNRGDRGILIVATWLARKILASHGWR
jgi:hypothetical protein